MQITWQGDDALTFAIHRTGRSGCADARPGGDFPGGIMGMSWEGWLAEVIEKRLERRRPLEQADAGSLSSKGSESPCQSDRSTALPLGYQAAAEERQARPLHVRALADGA